MSRVIVFDLDDTLYPERQFALSGFRAASRWAQIELGVMSLEAEMTRLLDEGHLGQLFPLVLKAARPNHTEAELKAFVRAYRDHEPEIALHEDGRRALERYGARGPLGLITDGTHSMQAAKVRALGIAHRFAEIVYTDALGARRAYAKPHSLAYERIASAMGGAHDRFVYVGDNPSKDFIAPNALGWTTVWVVRPGGIHDGAKVADGGAPQHTIQSLDELSTVLGD